MPRERKKNENVGYNICIYYIYISKYLYDAAVPVHIEDVTVSTSVLYWFIKEEEEEDKLWMYIKEKEDETAREKRDQIFEIGKRN